MNVGAILDKIFSGRYYLTFVCGGVFAYGVYSRIIPAETAAIIIILVFEWYFKRDDRKTPEVKP